MSATGEPAADAAVGAAVEPAALPAAKKRRVERRLVGSGDAAAPGDAMGEEELDALARERVLLMKRNQEMLATIGVASAVEQVKRAVVEEQKASADDGEERGVARPKARSRRDKDDQPPPQRRSSRLASVVAAEQIAEATAAEAGTEAGRGVGVMTQEEYLASKGLPLPEGHFRTDGRFKGWVAPKVAAEHGIKGSAAAAWEAEGGGQFKRKISKADVPSQYKKEGWSDARAFSASMLRKNPNAYFYRHTAPDKPQATGEWTQEEHDLFIATARKHGVGDKWGLFASYIPHRVGYQCSAYYKQVVIPSGLILDARFRMDAWGDAVYKGPKGARD